MKAKMGKLLKPKTNKIDITNAQEKHSCQSRLGFGLLNHSPAGLCNFFNTTTNHHKNFRPIPFTLKKAKMGNKKTV